MSLPDRAIRNVARDRGQKRSADDLTAGVQGHDDFGCERIESAPHQVTLRGIGLREIRPANQMGCSSTSARAHRAPRIRSRRFPAGSAAPRAAGKIACLILEKMPTRPLQGIGHAFHDAGEQRLDISNRRKTRGNAATASTIRAGPAGIQRGVTVRSKCGHGWSRRSRFSCSTRK